MKIALAMTATALVSAFAISAPAMACSQYCGPTVTFQAESWSGGLGKAYGLHTGGYNQSNTGATGAAKLGSRGGYGTVGATAGNVTKSWAGGPLFSKTGTESFSGVAGGVQMTAPRRR